MKCRGLTTLLNGLFFLICIALSSNAYSTVLDLSVDANSIGDVGSAQITYDELISSGSAYSLTFDFLDYDVASDVVLSFRSGLETAGGGSINLSPNLNGNDLGSYGLSNGYYYPGETFSSIVLDASYFNEFSNVLSIESSAILGLNYLIGDVQLTYTVPVPATLLLMLVGMSGLFYSRSQRA